MTYLQILHNLVVWRNLEYFLYLYFSSYDSIDTLIFQDISLIPFDVFFFSQS